MTDVEIASPSLAMTKEHKKTPLGKTRAGGKLYLQKIKGANFLFS